MKKVTLQDIADSLNISRVSVWKVFTGKPGISEELRNKVIAKSIELGYDVPIELKNAVPNQTPSSLTISVAVSRPETSTFWLNTIHEVAKEAAKQNVNVMYTYLPSCIDDNYVLPSVLTDGTVQGIIILNVYNDKLIKKLSAISLPKVFMDTSTSVPFESLNGDLMLIEGKSCIAKITEHIISLGKTKIGFIGDIEYAQTNFERYYGFKDAMRGHNLTINQNYCLTSSIGEDSYQEEIDNFLNKLKEMPEAFICASDYVANLLCKSLMERGYSIPKDILVSGFDAMDFNTPVPLTTVQVNNKDFGARLAKQIFYRMECPNAGRELTYICSNVIFRESTNITQNN